jgi:hypothetical protein
MCQRRPTQQQLFHRPVDLAEVDFFKVPLISTGSVRKAGPFLQRLM